MRPTFEPAAVPSREGWTGQSRIHFRAILNSYSEVLFLRGWRFGAVILTVTLLSPNVALAGLLAVLAAYAFARFIGMAPTFMDSGFYTYNPLLVGLSLGYLFRLTPLTVFFVVTAGISAFVLTHALFSASWHYLRLPVLSLPFVLVSSVAYLAAGQYTNLYVDSLYPRSVLALETAVPLWLGGFLRSLGVIFFMPTVVAGAVIAIALLVRSRILFLLAILGYYVGTLTLSALGGSTAAAFSDLNAFNFILISTALGGVFLIPSLRSYTLAIIAVVVSTVLMTSAEIFWSLYGVPVFALPFNLVTLTFVYILGLVDFPLLAKTSGTPEEVLDEHLAGASRYPGSHRTLALPFSGRWTVWQGFDGPWTHQGPWRYAYDFVITDDQGETHRGEGTRVEDYLAFRKPILSPVRGRVVRVVDGVPDNPIGVTDRSRNWGNLVVIEDERDFFVEISHFSEGSLKVREGDWVERGAPLGLCGNSGYSPQPHIHIQVQVNDRVGAPTVPFSFISYAEGRVFHANDTPSQDTVVEPLHPDRRLENRLGFVLDEVHRFRVTGCDANRFPGLGPGELELTVRMAPDSTFYLDSGKGRLFVGSKDGTFYAYRVDGDDPCLAAMFLALPRLPLANRPGLIWKDALPATLVARGPLRMALGLIRSLFPAWGAVTAELEMVTEETVAGRIRSPLLSSPWESRVDLHPIRGFERIQIGDLVLERIDET
jgi:urea transporter